MFFVIYPIEAPSTMFLSNACAFVTSLLTTNAFTGLSSLLPITSAN